VVFRISIFAAKHTQLGFKNLWLWKDYDKTRSINYTSWWE